MSEQPEQTVIRNLDPRAYITPNPTDAFAKGWNAAMKMLAQLEGWPASDAASEAQQ